MPAQPYPQNSKNKDRHALNVAIGSPICRSISFGNLRSISAAAVQKRARTKMAFGNNATRVLFVLMVMCATSTAKRPAGKESAAPAPAPEVATSEASGTSGIFDITKLGATSDGKTDCSKVTSRESSQFLAPRGCSVMQSRNVHGLTNNDHSVLCSGTPGVVEVRVRGGGAGHSPDPQG